jgi:hypothetical protein
MTGDGSISERLFVEAALARQTAEHWQRVAAERHALSDERGICTIDTPTAAPTPPPDPHAGLSADARVLLMLPRGDRFSYLLAALIKAALQDEKLRPGERLQLLEQLNACAAPAVLGVIEPMCATGLRMIDAAMGLDAGKADPPHHASFNMLTREDVWASFCQLNPSLVTAAKMPMARQ